MGIQSKADRHRFSHLRHSLIRLEEEVQHLIGPFLSDKAVVKGSVYELRRKCGKRGCKCVQGELHSSMVVSSSEKGKTKLKVIPKGLLVEVRIKVRRYQELRRVRSRLVEVHREMLQVIDEMEVMRREEVHPSGKKRSWVFGEGTFKILCQIFVT